MGTMGETSIYQSSTFKTSLSLRVDAAVGAMTVSPSGRDIALASRSGLFVIDLDDPFSRPRWLQHMTSWEVADIQWSPHASKPGWVISTSNQKALVWNLALPSSQAIEHMLHGHSRAITDINFHSHDPELLATCSIDSYVHVWDMRDPRKPCQSFADWFAGATQVKWNRVNGNVLASSHDCRAYIWDMRKGSIPMHELCDHVAKVNGIDFSRVHETKLITCSNDHTVKLWDYSKQEGDKAEYTLDVDYPVWRARHAPFGDGCLIMPLRGGGDNVDLYSMSSWNDPDYKPQPVHQFKGHSEPVKEFVWRYRESRDEGDEREFQLVTWSKDNDLRLWPVSSKTLYSVNYRRGRSDDSLEPTFYRGQEFPYVSYQKEPHGRSKSFQLHFTEQNQHRGSIPAISPAQKQRNYGKHLAPARRPSREAKKPVFMTGTSYYNFGGANRGPDNSQLHWISGVRIGRSAFAAPFDNTMGADIADHGPGGTGGSAIEAAPGNLGEEVSIVGHKFPKVTFEKIDISAGEFTISLNGPWGESTEGDHLELVFMRVDISIPQGYPFEKPSFLIEEDTKISKERADSIVSFLDEIGQRLTKHGRYCLEPCVRYLIGDRIDLDEYDREPDLDNEKGLPLVDLINDDTINSIDEDEFEELSNEFKYSSSSSSDEELERDELGDPSIVNKMNFDSTPIPKGCGATWSQSGMLICFFTGKKKNSNNLGGTSFFDPKNYISKAALSRYGGENGDADGDSGSSSEESFSSDSDEDMEFASGGDSLWPVKANLFRSRFPMRQPTSRASRSILSNTDRSDGTARTSERKNVVKILDYRHLIPSRAELAAEYKVLGASAMELAYHNMGVAEKFGFGDIADCWRIVAMILSTVPSPIHGQGSPFRWGDHPFGQGKLIEDMFAYFENEKNIQMLADLSCVLSGRTILKTTDSEMQFNDFNNATFPKSPFVHDLIPEDDSGGYFDIGTTAGPASSGLSAAMVQGSGAFVNARPGSGAWEIPDNGHDSYQEDENFGSPHSSSRGESSVMSISPEKFLSARRAVAGLFGRSGTTTKAAGRETGHSSWKSQDQDLSGIGSMFNSGHNTNQLASRNSFYGSDIEETGRTMPKVTVKLVGPMAEGTNQRNSSRSKHKLLSKITGRDGGTMLNPANEEKYYKYRSQYASILYSWGLAIESLEVLKFNQPSVWSEVPIRPPHFEDLKTAEIMYAVPEHPAADSEMLIRDSTRRNYLQKCHYCHLKIRTRFFQCPNCEHVVHFYCAEEWWERDQGGECASGCGCHCVQYW